MWFLLPSFLQVMNAESTVQMNHCQDAGGCCMGGSVKTIKRQHLRVYLSHCSIAVKRFCDQGNPLKKIIWSEVCLQFQRLSLLSSWQGAWRACTWQSWCWRSIWEFCFLRALIHSLQEENLVWAFETSNPQWHTSSKKATPLNPSNPTKELHSLNGD